jgi:hypothetical protein
MSRFASLRSLVILAPLVVLIGVMIPLATFAKGPIQNTASSASNDPSKLFAIRNDANCNVPNVANNPEVLFTFHAHDQVSGLAQMVSADATESNQEVLVLKETKGPFTKTIIPNTGTQSFKFTATRNGDRLTACYTLIGPDDESDLTNDGPNPLIDHPGAVFLKITH